MKLIGIISAGVGRPHWFYHVEDHDSNSAVIFLHKYIWVININYLYIYTCGPNSESDAFCTMKYVLSY